MFSANEVFLSSCRLAARALPAALLAALLAGCAAPPPILPGPLALPTAPLRVQVLAINDFHGHLKAPPGGIQVFDPADRSQRITVAAGGAAALASLVDRLRAQNPNTAFVAAGDLVGASPLLSSLFHDEPAIEAMNAMGLDAAALGNHELDQGVAEAQRLQTGGCHPVDGCKGPAPYAGARFPFLAANTRVLATGQTLFPAYTVKRFEGIPVAFVGVTLKGTAGMLKPANTAGLVFDDEADTVNALVPELKRQGIEAIVLLMHEGDIPTGDYNECPGTSGPLAGIVKRLDKAVDVVVTGHSHRAYNCVMDGRPVTSAGRWGTVVTQIDLVLDRQTRDVVSARAENIIARTASQASREYPQNPAALVPDSRVAELVSAYEQRVRPLAQRPVGRLGATFEARSDEAGNNPATLLVADAQLAATRDAGAEVAFMNATGVRAALGEDRRYEVVYEDVFAVQPFGNQLITVTLTGAQLLQLLERPLAAARPRPGLLHSKGLVYTWDASRPAGKRVVPGSLQLNGKPVTPEQRVRVTANDFLVDSNGSLFGQGSERQAGAVDVEALEQYIRSRPGLVPDSAPRITRLN